MSPLPPLGLKSFAPPFTLEGNYYALANVIVPSGGAASVTFGGIPTGYKHLQIRALTRATATGSATVNYVATGRIRFNGDISTSYNSHWLDGNGSGSGSSGNFGSDTSMALADLGGVFAASSSQYFASAIIDVLDYLSITKNKTVRILNGQDRNGYGRIQLQSGIWYATPQAVNSVTFTTDGTAYAEGSQFTLYGVK
jgi:hypothetical protein